MGRSGIRWLVGLPLSGPVRWYRDRAFVILTVAVGALLVWFGVGRGDERSQEIACWAAVTVLDVALGVTSHRIVAMLGRGDPARRFWRTVRLASVVYAVGFGVQLNTTIEDSTTRASMVGGAVCSASLAIGTAMIVVVLLRYPLGLRSRLERACFWLDLATVAAAVAAFGWYFALTAGGVRPRTPALAGLVATIEGPVVLLVAGFAVARLMIAGTAPYSRPAGMFAAATGVIGGLARGLGPTLVQMGHASAFYALTVAAHALAPAGVLAHARCLRSRQAPTPTRRRRPYSPLPYLAIAATYGLLVVTLARHEDHAPTWGVLAGAAGSTALVIARQLAAFADNGRLLAELRAALTERDALARELHRQAFSDTLTGLPNRDAFTGRLDEQFARARRHGWPVVVLLVDLDDFKPVNDRFGHHVGDRLLAEVARRLRQSLREVDMVARYGGDEFAILLAQPHIGSVVAVADRVLASLAEPCRMTGDEAAIHASIGVAVDEGGCGDPEELLRHADAAMYAAKRRGKGGYAMFDTTLDESPDFDAPDDMLERLTGT